MQGLALGVALALVAVMVGGCAVGRISSPFRKDPDRNVAANEERLPDTAPEADVNDPDALNYLAGNCPQFVAWPRDRMTTIYDVGQVGDSAAVRHRGEITKTARECDVGGDRVTVKYGFSGRILLGPRGRAGQISLPIRIQVTDGSRNVIASDTMQVSAVVDGDAPSGTFSVVREVTFRVAPGSRPGDYKLFVAFVKDSAGAG
jgi:hypothetical protein